MQSKFYDVAVVGAGVFGVWIAYQLNQAGASVLLIDAYGPGNSRSSSGGESRILRLGYGPDEIYTRSAQRSYGRWLSFFEQYRTTTPLFRRTGMLFLAREHDPYCEATLTNLRKAGARCERLTQAQLSERFPQLNFEGVDWAVLETDAGMLMARRAVEAVAAQARANGVEYRTGAAVAPVGNESLRTVSGDEIRAKQFVFACGPWLPKLFPELLAGRIHVTRQELVFLGVPPGDTQFSAPHMPIWIDFNDLIYGIPDAENRGLKIAIDAHGPEFDPDHGERIVSPESIKVIRDYLARRIPSFVNAPITESRVCQYENTSNGDFLIDRHPEIANVWLVGGGSGHGFKHGPAVGEYVAAMIAGSGQAEPRFSLVTKARVQQREVF